MNNLNFPPFNPMQQGPLPSLNAFTSLENSQEVEIKTSLNAEFSSTIVNQKPRACDRLIQSSVFSSYLSQLNDFVFNAVQSNPLLSHALLDENVHAKEKKTDFEEKGVKWVSALLKLSQSPQEESKQEAGALKRDYQLMILNLRALIRQREEALKTGGELTPPLCKFMDDFCHWMYSGPYLWTAMCDYLEREGQLRVNVTVSSNPTPSEIFELLYTQYVSLRENLDLVGFDEPSKYVDFNYQGDVPSYLFTVPGQNTRLIRMPTVTRDTLRNAQSDTLEEVEVIDEFINYLSQNPSHLYINLMDRQTQGSEAIRSHAIENLEKHPKVAPSISVITFDKDSDFYFQRNRFATFDISEHFKQEFMEQMFNPQKNGAFYWSDKLDPQDWQNRCLHILESVHRVYFGNNIRLSAEERMQFIEIAYSQMTQELIEILQPTSCNVSCRKCIDRGASALTLLYANYLKQNEIPLTENEAKRLCTLALGPAALIENRQPHENRISRLAPCLSRVLAPSNYREAEKGDLLATLNLLSPSQLQNLKTNISQYISYKNLSIPKKSFERTLDIAAACYIRSQAIYGPIALDWADSLMRKADQDGKKLIFMARDGSTPYKIACYLLEKYPKRYPNLSPEHLMYGYFSRKIVDDCKEGKKEGQQLLIDYVKQLGVKTGDKCLFVDIGFSGSMVDPIKALLAPLNLQAEFEFLFSLSPKAQGFVDNEEINCPARPQYGEPHPFKAYPVNEVGVHWIEDSHQGTIKSPTKLVKVNDVIYPNTHFPGTKQTFRNEPASYLWRKCSQKGVVNFARTSFSELKPKVDKKILIDTMVDMQLKNLHLYIPHFSIILN